MRRPFALAACVVVLCLCGCQPQTWVIVVENHTCGPCTVGFDTGPGSDLCSTEVARGSHVIATGTDPFLLKKVRVYSRGSEYERAGPKMEPGYTFVVTVAIDGQVTTHVSDR